MKKAQKSRGRIRISAVLIFFLTCAAVYAAPPQAPVLADETTRPTAYVQSYTVEGNLAAGENIVIHFTVCNASQTVPVNSLLLQLSCPSGAFSPSPGTTSQHYIRQIPAGGTAVADAQVTVKSTLPNGTYDIAYALSYQGPDSVTATMNNTGIISLAVMSNALKIAEISVPEQHSEDKLAYVSVRYTNAGEIELRGAKVLIEGNIGANEKILDIGTVRAGAGGIAEKNILFTGPGEQHLLFYLVYEDINGNQVISDSFESTTRVSAAVAPPPQAGQDPDEAAEQLPPEAGEAPPERTASFLWRNPVLAIVGIAVLCAAVIALIFILKRKK